MIYEPYITTQQGNKFHFLAPQQDEIAIKDIAFALSNTCRFNGHVPFFSVAEHSVAVAARVPPRLQLAALLHDASEAYLADIPSPIKQYLPDYQALEAVVQAAIYDKYKVSLSDADKKELKQADLDATYTEAFCLLEDRGRDWVPVLFSPSEQFQPRCIPPPEAFKMFMFWFSELTNTTVENEIIVVGG